MAISFRLDGRRVEVADETLTLLDALREQLAVRTAKDGCAPQGQCGCCTVWVDGAPRVACVTPVRRIQGREVTTVEGLDPSVRDKFSDALVATGGSQCGFCTPGIVMRLAALGSDASRDDVERGLLAHLCRCTGWRSVVDACFDDGPRPVRDLAAASRRATLEGGATQRVGRDVVFGHGGFADDTAPGDALVALINGEGDWVVGETLGEARELAGKVQGRRTTMPLRYPLEIPEGDWDLSLRTTWVEPAYLEPDASWCAPGGEPVSSLGNGGGFGGKLESDVAAVARRLADVHGRTVRALMTREDVVRRGPKRPPIAAGVRADGTGIVRVVRTPGIATAIAAVLPRVEVEELDVVGPPTSAALRGAGWVEAAVLRAGLARVGEAVAPNSARASARFADDGSLRVSVACGEPLDEVVLRSYCVGAAHMALGWVRSEGLAVDVGGEVQDLTIRSFGILRAVDTPDIHVTVAPGDSSAVNGSDAVFAAVAAAAWMDDGLPPAWPTRRA